MKKFIYIIAVVAVTLLSLSSCGDDNFTVESKVENMGTQNIRILYITDDNVSNTWLPAINGEFTFTGNSEEYAIVNIITQTGETVTQAIARNGNLLEITGNYRDKLSIKVSGNKVNDSYFSFIQKNQELLKSEDKTKIDAEIIKYIGNNRDNIASTMLLFSKFSDINNKQLVDSLLNLIEEDARPENITEYYLTDINRTFTNDSIVSDTIKPFYMSSLNEQVYRFDPANGGKGVSVIYLWGDDTTGQSSRIYSLNSMRNWHKGKELQITDVSLMQDKYKWERVINRDSVPWVHLQAIGAEFNGAIKSMDVTQTPLYIVTDSVGAIIYRGSELNSVSSTLDKHLKTNKDKKKK